MTVVFHIAGDKTWRGSNQAPTWRNETTTEVVLKAFIKPTFDRSSRVYRTALTYADLSAYMKVQTC